VAPFRFRLQRVLDWQSKVCRLEEENVRLCRYALAETEARMAQLRADLASIEREALSRRALQAADLAALERFRLMTQQSGRKLEAKRLEQVRELEKQLRIVQAERRRLRMIEKLRERAETEYRTEAGRELEAQALDSHLSKWVRETVTPGG
jgi:flagellar FliJ protein